MDISTQPIWVEPSVSVATQPASRTADVGIIGGGITALSAGISLLQAGFSVQILEGREALSGASSRAFGNVDVGASQSMASLIKSHGLVTGEKLWLESAHAAIALQEHIKHQGIECDYLPGGHLKIAFHPRQEAAIVGEYDELTQAFPQQGIELLDSTELSKRWPGRKGCLGLLNPLTATINPYKFSLALLSHFCSLGGNYTAHCEVTAVKRITEEKFELLHNQGETRVTKLISATNGYTSRLTPWLKRRVFPVGSYIFATSPLNEEMYERFSSPHQIVTTAYNFKQYMRLDKDRRLIFGGRLGLSSGLDEMKVKQELTRLAKHFLPFIDSQCTHVWGGNLGFTKDMIPHLGQVEKGHYYAAGYCGRGLPLAWLYGRHVADIIIDDQNLEPLCAVSVPFPSIAMIQALPFRNKILSSFLSLKDRLLFNFNGL